MIGERVYCECHPADQRSRASRSSEPVFDIPAGRPDPSCQPPLSTPFAQERLTHHSTTAQDCSPELRPDLSGAAPSDERAVRDLLRKLLEAWGRGDGPAYGALFTEDADYVALTARTAAAARRSPRSTSSFSTPG
jgi:hypothetical protein